MNNTLISKKSYNYGDLDTHINVYHAFFINIFMFFVYILLNSFNISKSKKKKIKKRNNNINKILHDEELFDFELDINLNKFDYYP